MLALNDACALLSTILWGVSTATFSCVKSHRAVLICFSNTSFTVPHPKWTFSRVLPKVCQHMMRPCVPLKHACILLNSCLLMRKEFWKVCVQLLLLASNLMSLTALLSWVLLSDICCNLNFHHVCFQLFWKRCQVTVGENNNNPWICGFLIEAL